MGILAAILIGPTICGVPEKVIKYFRLYSNMSLLLGVVWIACGAIGEMPKLLGAGVALTVLTLGYIMVAKNSNKG